MQVRLITLLILAGFLQVSARGYGQEVTIRARDVSLTEVFQSIRKQTGYLFVYDLNMIREAKNVSLHVKNMPLEKALALCFKDQPLTYTIVDKTIVVKKKPAPVAPPRADTTITVRGKVVNEKGEGIAGASVRVKDANFGAITDTSGFFYLKHLSEKAILVFSSIGYENTTVSLNGQHEITIQLQSALSKLSGVDVTVSTGYQDIPKERATGSFDFIGNKQFNERVSTDILSRLEGMASGLNFDRITTPSSDYKIMIRGLSTIRGPKGPLIVVNNFPYEGNLSNINPNDVKNITILKDAAAASIWGAKAGNGVIVINLKNGNFNQSMTTEVTANLTLINKPNLFYPSRISTNDEINAELFLFNKGYRLADTGNYNKPVISPVYEILLAQRNGRISASEAKDKIDALRKHDIRKDLDEYFYQKAFNQQYAINVQGGSKKMSWIFSTGLGKNIDWLSAKSKRINLRWNDTYKPLKRLKINTGIYYTQNTDRSGKPGYGEIISNPNRGIFPYATLAGPHGESVALPKLYRKSYIDTAGGGKLLNWEYYPLEDYKHSVNTTKQHDVLINVGLKYSILPMLNISLKYQYEKQITRNRREYDMQSFYARNLINTFTNLSTSGAGKINPVPKGNILDLSNGTLSAQAFRGQINYNNRWNNGMLSAIGGWQINEKNTLYNSNRIYGFEPKNYTFINVDNVNEYPTFVTGSSGQIPNNDELTNLLSRFVSFYANAAYTYKERYTLSASARRDASNIFGVKTNDKWKPLWSAGLSWNVSKEDFYKSSLLPFLKFRITYGYSGNVNPAWSGVTTIRYSGTSPYTLSPYARFSNYYNPDLQWETSAQLNIGLDFRLIDNRLSGSIDYYRKRNTNLMGTAQLDYTGGVGPTIFKNAATTKGRGIDIALNSVNLKGRFSWRTDFNLSFNKGEVVKNYLATERGSNYVGGNARISAIPGKPVYAIYSYKWAGLAPSTGNPQGYDGDKITEDYNSLTFGSTINDLVYNGTALPKFFGSFGNTFSWQNWSLTARLIYKFGYYFFKNALSYGSLHQNWTTTADFSNRWQKPGDEKHTTVPSMIYPLPSNRDDFYAGSEVNVLNGSYIRLQYVTLSYQLNLKHADQLLKDIRIYSYINNVGILWRANKAGIDPEYMQSIPAPCSYTLGIRATF